MFSENEKRESGSSVSGTEEERRKLRSSSERICTFTMAKFIVSLCWHALHLMVNVVLLFSRLIHVLKYHLISIGILQRHCIPKFNKLQYLAVVFDSEEAKHVDKIRRFLNWLSVVGISHVILYDMEGVLKKSELDFKIPSGENQSQFSDPDIKASIPISFPEKMSLEILSFSDGKEAVAKAASFLYSKIQSKIDNIQCDTRHRIFNESDIGNALKAVGYGGPEPNLMLVFGHARCHMGFPAWRMRYTEIVHLGPLESMKYHEVMEAIDEFSRKNQNYGS